ncbi:ribosomal protein S18-alanine N-acetyltransferase [Sphingobium algorifonticola]|uniref:Ribosomal-protein-alanine N-acetyltransferase n=1 Tax=Sphingobium algorifonticola TaxID=2008318 RepID=A0A437J7I8_9SPHN|nr:ribosomal protein S18-alanine N-acetyltransferase [Sphingobium algorifonticola]RVT40984.1 ribosomal-protein-alanine N-acetyltransferase [Sphingobium algorifonticola]
MIHGLVLERHEQSDRKAQAAAMSVMDKAFDPAFGEAWNLSQLAGMMAMHGSWLTLAKLDAAVLGFALVRSIFDESELLLLAVDPGWRGRGIGSALLNDCIALARTRGIAMMHLEVRADNIATKLYKNTGFLHVNTRPDYYRGNDGKLRDALSYRLDL